MNPGRLLMLPWMALSRPWRIGVGACASIVVVLYTVAVGVVASYRPGTAWQLHDTHGAATLCCLFWAAVPSQSLLLAREAHRLRLPGLGREVNASLALYALLTIALPSLLLAMLDGNGAVALTEFALGAGLGLAYATLPPYLGIWACCAPMLANHDAGRWLPDASASAFLAWAAPCTAALWLLLGWNWRRAVYRDYGLEGSRRPILLVLRMLAWYGRGADNDLETQQLRRGVRWLQRTVDLRGSGPGHAFTNLRVALGGWYMPQTPGSRLRQLGVMAAGLASVALLVVLPMLGTADQKDAHAIPSGTILLMIYSGMIGPLLAVVHTQALQRRWHRTNAELPLLALLPRLGPAHATKRALLRASVLPGLVAQALCLLAVLGVAAWLHLGAFDNALLLFGQLAGMGMLLVLTLAVLGGVTWRPGWLAVFAAGGILLIAFSGTLMLPLFGDHALIDYPAVVWIFATAWAAFLAPLFRLGWRGWFGFRRRPHPFLSTT